MGYQKKTKVYVLKFQDEELEGLVVKAKSVSIGSLLGLIDASKLGRGSLNPEDLSKLDGLFDTFASALLEWNLENEDGEPVTFDPIKVDGVRETPREAKARVLKEQDLDFALDLIMAWLDAIVGVTGPLGQQSSGGNQSPEEPINMETL